MIINNSLKKRQSRIDGLTILVSTIYEYYYIETIGDKVYA